MGELDKEAECMKDDSAFFIVHHVYYYQSMGDEPLCSMFDGKYNVFNDCGFKGNNKINQTVNQYEFEANNTSNNTNNYEKVTLLQAKLLLN